MNKTGSIPAFMNWSSGKDAAFSLYHIQQEGKYDIRYLFTTVNKGFGRISMHGVRKSLLKEQTRQIGLPLKIIELPENLSMEDYGRILRKELSALSLEGISHAIYGDIFLDDLRAYREKQLAQEGMQAVFPLWKKDTRTLITQFLDAGFKAIVTCVDAHKLERSFVGRVIDDSWITALPKDVDPCGENGEFHTFVFDGPVFKNTVAFEIGNIVEKEYAESTSSDQKWSHQFYFCDLIAK